ncbi:MAG: hypothetical protein R3F37_01840 [Candidatus Competibacteraceae bacterium]
MWNTLYQNQVKLGAIRPPQQSQSKVQPLQSPNIPGAQHIDPEMMDVNQMPRIPDLINDFRQTSRYGDAGIESGNDTETDDELYAAPQKFMDAQEEGGITGFNGEFHGINQSSFPNNIRDTLR